ncbi:MAG: type IV pilus assembly protein PilM [Nitrospirae bacterium]|nr:type IV pilus assembly protein PilM [Nitrospirota bacterium]
MLLSRSKGIIGLDIGSRHIKAVQLKDVKDGYQLERISVASLPPELIVDGSIIDSPRVVEAIKGLISDAAIKVKDTAIAISGHSSVIIKKISVSQMTEEELNDSIKFEAEQYVPFDIEDVNLDFQILGAAEEQNKMDVIIVAVKKDKINEYVSVVKESGLNPVIVDVDVFALANLYEISYEVKPQENIALINVGASTINMHILNGGMSVFTRYSPVGSNMHTEALQKQLAASYNDAEKLKRGESVEGVHMEDVASVLNSASEDIIAEISRSFDYYRGATNEKDINEIILSGGCAMVKDFAPLLAERIGTEVKIMEPFKNIIITEGVDKNYLKKVSPVAVVAMGLALRGVGDR